MSFVEKLIGKIEDSALVKINTIIKKIFSSKEESDNNLNFDLYRITFNCLDKLERYSLTEDKILKELKKEFQSHINYFKWDLRDYPFPLKIDYIIQLDKTEKEIVIRNIYKCTKNQAQVVKWDNILSSYRQLTRYKYREDENEIIRNKALVSEVVRKHSDLKNLLIEYFKKHYNLSVGFGSSCKTQEEKDINLELSLSAECLMRISDIMNGYKKGFVSPEDMKKIVITEIEKSLQHLHKIIVLYPPKQEELAESPPNDG